MSGDEMINKPQHDSGNDLFDRDFIESMHSISVEDVVEIGTMVVKRVVKNYKVKKGFETFDVSKAPLIQRELRAMKKFLITDDAVNFMKRQHSMENRLDVVHELKSLMSHLFIQVLIYIYRSMKEVIFIDRFSHLRWHGPSDWIAEYMTDKFVYNNYIFTRTGKDTMDGLWIM